MKKIEQTNASKVKSESPKKAKATTKAKTASKQKKQESETMKRLKIENESAQSLIQMAQINAAEYENSLSSIQRSIVSNDSNSALKVIDPLKRKLDSCIQTFLQEHKEYKIEFVFFFSMMENALYREYYYQPSILQIPFPYDIVSLYTLEGQAYFQKGNFTQAKECIHNAMKYDPINVDLLFLSADLNRNQFNWFSYKSDLDKIHTFMYKEEDFRKYYRYLQTYYTEYEKNPLLAKLLAKLGNEKNKNTLYQTWMLLTDSQKKLLNEYEIPYDLSDFVLNVLISACKICLLYNNIQGYKYYFNVFVKFRNDKQINELIHDEGK